MTSRLQGIQELHGRLELERQSLLSQTRQERQFHSADCPVSNPRYPQCQVAGRHPAAGTGLRTCLVTCGYGKTVLTGNVA
jgi:hypothetical protein